MEELKYLKEQITTLKTITYTYTSQLKKVESEAKSAKDEAKVAKNGLKYLNMQQNSQSIAIDQLKTENQGLISRGSKSSDLHSEELKLVREELNATKEKIEDLKSLIKSRQVNDANQVQMSTLKAEIELLKASLNDIKEPSINKPSSSDQNRDFINRGGHEYDHEVYNYQMQDYRYDYHRPKYSSDRQPSTGRYRGRGALNYHRGQGSYNRFRGGSRGRGNYYTERDYSSSRHNRGGYRNEYRGRYQQSYGRGWNDDRYDRYSRSNSQQDYEYVPKQPQNTSQTDRELVHPQPNN